MIQVSSAWSRNQTRFYLPAKFFLPFPHHTTSHVWASCFVWKVCTVLVVCRDQYVEVESYRCDWVCLALFINKTKPNDFVLDTDHRKQEQTILNHFEFLSSSFIVPLCYFFIFTLKIPLGNATEDEERKDGAYPGIFWGSIVTQRREMECIKKNNACVWL